MKPFQIVVLVLFDSNRFKGVRLINARYALQVCADPFAIGVLPAAGRHIGCNGQAV